MSVAVPSGLWIQPYRAEIPGGTEAAKVAAFAARLDALEGLGGYLVGLAPHGFTTELNADRWNLWREMAAARGLACGVAYGLDDSDPSGKGARIAAVASQPGCALVLLNAESSWDQSDDGAKVDAMCAPIAKAAPRVALINQSWPVPTSHSGYPFSTFAKWCRAFAEERYYNDWKSQYGTARYRRTEPWFNQSWGTLERNELGPQNRLRPHWPTFQGYTWTDIEPDCITAQVKYDSGPLFVWSEWFPEESFLRAARCVASLHAKGYSGPGAVWNFQSDTPPLSIDGICGPATRAALGVA